MKPFIDYLTEDLILEAKGPDEPPHVEDMPALGGNEGVAYAADVLEDLHTQLSGKTKAAFNAPKAKTFVSQHFDGMPLIFGKHPGERKFFLAADPKVPCFSHEDIDKNYGGTPLAMKLHHAMVHIPKVMPKRGIFQGELMYDDDTLVRGKTHHEFTPNAITYKIDARSPDGRDINQSRIGLVVHTGFNNAMEPQPITDYSQFPESNDVHMINHTISSNPDVYTAKHRAEFTNHIENAKINYAKMKPETLDIVKAHGQYMSSYINHTLRGHTKVDINGYIEWLGNQANHAASKEEKKSPIIQKYANLIQDAQTNQGDLKNAFNLHNDLSGAKNSLIDALSKNREGWSYHIGGKKLSGPEGFTVYREGGEPVRLVNRKTQEKVNSTANKLMR